MLEKLLWLIPFYKRSQDSKRQAELYEGLLAESQAKTALFEREAESTRKLSEEKSRTITLLQRDVARYSGLLKNSGETTRGHLAVLKGKDKKIASLEEDAKRYITLIEERENTIYFQEEKINGDEALLKENAVKTTSLEKRVSELDSLASILKKKVIGYERDYFINKAIVQSVGESSVPVLVAHQKDYTIIYANSAAGETIEYEHTELGGKNFFSLFNQSGLEAEFSTAIKEAPFERRLNIGKKAIRCYVSVFRSEERGLIAMRMEEMGAVDKKVEQAKEIASGAVSAVHNLLEKLHRSEQKGPNLGHEHP